MAPRTMFRCILRFSLSEASPLFVAERVLLHEDADAQRGEGPDVGSDAVGVRLSAVAAGIDVADRRRRRRRIGHVLANRVPDPRQSERRRICVPAAGRAHHPVRGAYARRFRYILTRSGRAARDGRAVPRRRIGRVALRLLHHLCEGLVGVALPAHRTVDPERLLERDSEPLLMHAWARPLTGRLRRRPQHVPMRVRGHVETQRLVAAVDDDRDVELVLAQQTHGERAD